MASSASTIERMIETDDQVAVIARRSGKGEHSGLEVSDEVVQVFTFEGETCVRVHEYYDRETALREIGVSERAE